MSLFPSQPNITQLLNQVQSNAGENIRHGNFLNQRSISELFDRIQRSQLAAQERQLRERQMQQAQTFNILDNVQKTTQTIAQVSLAEQEQELARESLEQRKTEFAESTKREDQRIELARNEIQSRINFQRDQLEFTKSQARKEGNFKERELGIREAESKLRLLELYNQNQRYNNSVQLDFLGKMATGDFDLSNPAVFKRAVSIMGEEFVGDYLSNVPSEMPPIEDTIEQLKQIVPRITNPRVKAQILTDIEQLTMAKARAAEQADPMSGVKEDVTGLAVKGIQQALYTDPTKIDTSVFLSQYNQAKEGGYNPTQQEQNLAARMRTRLIGGIGQEISDLDTSEGIDGALSIFNKIKLGTDNDPQKISQFGEILQNKLMDDYGLNKGFGAKAILSPKTFKGLDNINKFREQSGFFNGFLIPELNQNGLNRRIDSFRIGTKEEYDKFVDWFKNNTLDVE